MTRAQAGSGNADRRDSPVSRDQIVATAMRIGDEETLEALTMRRLASEVGLGTMTLYGYFKNKDELLDAMADDVLGTMEFDVPSDAPVDEVVRSLALAFLQTFRSHPSVVRVLTTRTTTSHRAMLGAYERALERLVQSGLSPAAAVHVYGLTITYALGFASYARPRPWGDGRADEPGARELRASRSEFYGSLPAQDFPIMRALREDLVNLPSLEQFSWGLDVLVAGMVATSAAAE